MSDVIEPSGQAPGGAESAAQGGLVPSGLFRAQVVSVDTAEFTCTIHMEEAPFSTFTDIPWTSPYLHQAMGEGAYMIPEPGSSCIAASMADGRAPIIIGWVMVEEEGSFRGGRLDGNPGDQVFRTRDGNFLILRRGGIVQIGSTALAQRVFLPVRNLVQDIFENYRLTGVPGELVWETFREEDDSDGHRRCLLTLHAYEYADDPAATPLIALKLGSHAEGSATILSLETRDKGGGVLKSSLTLSKDGTLSWTLGDCQISTKGLDWKVSGTASLQSTGPMTFSSSASVGFSAPSVSFSAGGASMGMSKDDGTGQTKIRLDGSAVELGAATAPVMLATQDMQRWLLQVTAAVKSIDPTLPDLLGYFSTKVSA